MKESLVAAVYTAPSIVPAVSDLVKEILPEVRLVNIVDSGLIADVIAAGAVTVGAARRLMHCYMAGVDAGASVILSTCSSIGDVVEHAQVFVPIRILRIDQPMAARAVREGRRVGVLATLLTTLAPTVRLVRAEAARAEREVTVVEGLARGAYEALVSGDVARHDDLLVEAARRVASSSDVIVLAQGSMARMEAALARDTGRPVLSSPRSGVEALRELLGL